MSFVPSFEDLRKGLLDGVDIEHVSVEDELAKVLMRKLRQELWIRVSSARIAGEDLPESITIKVDDRHFGLAAVNVAIRYMNIEEVWPKIHFDGPSHSVTFCSNADIRLADLEEADTGTSPPIVNTPEELAEAS